MHFINYIRYQEYALQLHSVDSFELYVVLTSCHWIYLNATEESYCFLWKLNYFSDLRGSSAIQPFFLVPFFSYSKLTPPSFFFSHPDRKHFIMPFSGPHIGALACVVVEYFNDLAKFS